MISVTIATENGTRKVSGLPNRFKNNLASAPYHLEVAAINGQPVTAHCDTCGCPLCEDDKHVTHDGFIWCNTCMPASN